METYINIDRQSDLLASLEELRLHTRTPLTSPIQCKWALIAAHSAMQGAMCIALRGSAGFDTWKPQHSKKWMDAYEKGEALPDTQLDYFLELYDKLFDANPTIDRHLISWLNETRNNLVHFNTDSYSIGKNMIVASIVEAVKAVKKTRTLSKGIYFYEEPQSEEFTSLCYEIDAQMARHKAV